MTSFAAKGNMKIQARQINAFCKSIQVFAFVFGLGWQGLAQTIPLLILEEEQSVSTYTSLSTVSAQAVLASRLWPLVEQGYVFASFDTTAYSQDTLVLKLSPGTLFQWHEDLQLQLLARRAHLEKSANNGRPFAYYTLDSLVIKDGEVNGTLSFEGGPEITFDTLRVIGESPLSRKYLMLAMGTKPGTVYSDRRFGFADDRIKELPQIDLLRPIDIAFAAGKATPIAHLTGVKTDQFEGILGLLSDPDGESVVTGYLNLHLGNLFRSGKELHLKWNRFAQESQQLNLQYQHPFFLQSNLAVGLSFSLLRQDSSFVNRDFHLHLGIPLVGSWKLGLTIATRSGDILGTDPNPEAGLDFRVVEYRPEVYFGGNIDLNSQNEGIKGNLQFGFGEKRILRNQIFDPTIYDDVDLRTSNYQLQAEVAAQKGISKQLSLFSEFSAGLLRGRQILRNEFYRIGGLLSLRGFNENVFFAQDYMKVRNEIRLFFGKRSYLMALYDFARINSTEGEFFANSLGGGISFDTSGGHFNFAMAVGDIDGFSFNLQEAKAHFGYVVTF